MESIGAAKAMRSLGVAKGLLGEVDSAVALLEGACKIFAHKLFPLRAPAEACEYAFYAWRFKFGSQVAGSYKLTKQGYFGSRHGVRQKTQK